MTSNPSAGLDEAKAVVRDGTNLYIVGYDELNGSGNAQWRTEQRRTSDGTLVTSFGVNGVDTSNSGSRDDTAHAVAVDATYIYVTGRSSRPWDIFMDPTEWRIERIPK